VTGVATPLVDDAMVGAAIAVVVLAVVALYRLFRGPTLPDRVVAVNGFGTSTLIVLALLSVGLDEPGLLDVALVYALLNFLLSLGLATYAGDGGEGP